MEEERAAAKQLELLLNGSSPLTAIKRDGDRENSVKVSKFDNGYKASVTRRTQKSQERFEERFRYPETLVFFLEKFTSVTVNDFQKKPTTDIS